MPFYKKEGENWVPLGDKPLNIQVGQDSEDRIGVYPVEGDEDQIGIALQGSVFAVGPKGVIFPGTLGPNGEVLKLSGRDIIFENFLNGAREIIIFSKEPINGQQ